MIELANKDIKIFIMIIAHMFKKLGGRLSMLSGDCEKQKKYAS